MDGTPGSTQQISLKPRLATGRTTWQNGSRVEAIRDHPGVSMFALD